jgi:hypothetical protein
MENLELTAQDVVEIQNLVYRYCWHIDHGDLRSMALLFEHAEVTLTAGVYWKRYSALIRAYTPTVRHVPGT